MKQECITCGTPVEVNKDYQGEVYCSNDCWEAAML